MYTGGADYTVKKWQIKQTDPHPYKGKEYIDGEVFKDAETVAKHKRMIKAICQKGDVLFSAAYDGSIKIIKESGYCGCLKINDSIHSMRALDDGLVAAGSEGIWRVDYNTLKIEKVINVDKVINIANYTENCFFAGLRNGIVKLWDFRAGIWIKDILAHNDEVTGIDSCESKVLTCSDDGYLKIWDLRGFQNVNSWNSGGKLFRAIWNQEMILTGGDCLRVWENGKGLPISQNFCKDTLITKNNIIAAIGDKVFVWNINSLIKY